MIDWAFASLVSHINIKGIGRPERSSKVDRFQEILETLRRDQESEEIKMRCLTDMS